jgi:hypothetical protein
MGLRLAATDLLPQPHKRAVVYAGSGSLGENAFSRYSLSELAAYLNNNGIAFYVVLLSGGANSADAGPELRYLVEETGGAILPLYRDTGIGPALRQLSTAADGSYMLSYRSSLQTNFGQNYLPVEATVYLMDRSGRDSSGYFAALE